MATGMRLGGVHVGVEIDVDATRLCLLDMFGTAAVSDMRDALVDVADVER